jgi:hypothetical protein
MRSFGSDPNVTLAPTLSGVEGRVEADPLCHFGTTTVCGQPSEPISAVILFVDARSGSEVAKATTSAFTTQSFTVSLMPGRYELDVRGAGDAKRNPASCPARTTFVAPPGRYLRLIVYCIGR